MSDNSVISEAGAMALEDYNEKVYENYCFSVSNSFNAQTWMNNYLYADEERYRMGNHILGYVKSLDMTWLVVGRLSGIFHDEVTPIPGCFLPAMDCLTALRRPYFRCLVAIRPDWLVKRPYIEELNLKDVLAGDKKVWNTVKVDGSELYARVERIVPCYALKQLAIRFRKEESGSAKYFPEEKLELPTRRFLHICGYKGKNFLYL
jgi:hypothetical protein